MERFGRYTLVKRLGAGGMGEVFLARGESGEVVTIKRILPHLTENPRFLRLFLDETRIASRLVHPNIARIVEFGEVRGAWFVAMEYVQGHDLRELLKRAREAEHPVPPQVVAHVAHQVAAALDFAHRATDAQGRHLQIVHRDVTPHNVLVTGEGVVKLVDFGVAKAANKAVHTAAGMLKGKFPYMAPEQAGGRHVDGRTDVFALGIVMWEALTGAYLFRGKTDAQSVRAVRACEVPLVRERRPDCPVALERVVMKALRKAPEARHQTARELLDALGVYLADAGPFDFARWYRQYEDVPGLDDDGALKSPSEGPGDEQDAETIHVGAEVSESGAVVAGSPLARVERSGAALSGEVLAEARRVLGAVSQRPPPLSPQATSFVGRVAELADLHQLFRQGARLLTLLGPGGTGKTRLSLEFAGQLGTHFEAIDERGRRRGGVWFVELADARDVDGVCAALSRALTVPLAPGDAVEQLGHALAARGDTLVVLDNFEQVVGHARETLEPWMRAAPLARFMVSSRELLRLPHETVYEVPPLRTPGPTEAARGAEAVELFIERARVVRPGWVPTPADEADIAEIVRQLDGLPLAIELAAARMSLFTPGQLVQRLPRRFEVLVDKRGAPERQATLRGAIDWSWTTLGAAEQSALAQLSVFAGGFTAEAVDAVVSLAHCEGAPTASAVSSTLREKSLVRAYFPTGDEARPRFGLYETIREYAREKLMGSAVEAGALSRHTRYFLELGRGLADGAESSASQLSAIDLERENLLAVYRRGLDPRAPARQSLDAVLALDPLLTLRGPFKPHLPMLDAALARCGDDPARRVEGLEARGKARLARGSPAEAVDDFEEAHRLARALGDVGREGRIESFLGVARRLLGDRGESRRHFTRALALLEHAKDRRMEGRCLSTQGALLAELGLETEALASYERALEIHREVKDRRYEGITLANLGVAEQAMGLFDQARANYRKALEIHRELGNRRSEGISHSNLGDLYRDQKKPGPALVEYQRALELLREVGARRHEGIVLVAMGALHQEKLELPAAAERYGAAIELLEALGEVRYLALARAGLAGVEAIRGRLGQAEALLSEASAALVEVNAAWLHDALELHRGVVEWGHVMHTRSPAQARTLEGRVARRIEQAERAQPPDAQHPAGASSPVDRNEHVRAALRILEATKAQFGRRP
ncbi:MAG: protein kinase [Myxococcaceae bacterium]|jgi:serine/threonine protein kinase/predicted ATPase|nr:protein kinase [Myxococcaceae bacterium]